MFEVDAESGSPTVCRGPYQKRKGSRQTAGVLTLGNFHRFFREILLFFFAEFRVSYINELSELRFGVRAASCRLQYDLMNRVLYDCLSRYQGQGIKAKDLRDFITVSGLKFVGVCRALQNTCKSGSKGS